MAINTLIQAQNWTGELDKAFVQKAVTGFLADNALTAKFVGAKTVLIPNIDFAGLVNYDRDNGFNRAALTVANEPFTMQMDRARSIQLDRMDEDETGVANLAGQVMGEFVRTKVVPECDAYVLSTLAGIADTNSNTVTWNPATPYESLINAFHKVYGAAGYDEELVAFVSSDVMAKLETSAETSKSITISDFKQGGVNFKVKSINGVTLIPVAPDRMKTAYEFSTTTGGYTPASDAKDIHFIVLPKKAASLVKKTEKMRVFTPDENIDADAYKFDYRIYYDVFVKQSKTGAICGAFAG